jgi:hypothetical protein
MTFLLAFNINRSENFSKITIKEVIAMYRMAEKMRPKACKIHFSFYRWGVTQTHTEYNSGFTVYVIKNRNKT